MDYSQFGKRLFAKAGIFAVLTVSACTYNPATGERQFTGLMSPQQEKALGAEAHQDIIKEYGGVYNHPGLQAYLNEIGQRVAARTERSDVTYRFTLLDSPVVNAFALPGGYVYVTRGLLALASDEDELASVIAHEIGHVTARHQAERYSQSVVTALGAGIVSAVVGQPAVSEALNLGSNLYISSYSRGQESQADDLGIRYLSRAGYDPSAMGRFLHSLDMYDAVERKEAGASHDPAASIFSTHPVTAQRVAESTAEATNYPARPATAESRDRYLAMIRGMTFGDNLTQGFVRNRTFYHPELGFVFSVPAGFKVHNDPDQVLLKGKDGSIVVMDMVRSRVGADPSAYMLRDWLGNKPVVSSPEQISINGMPAATLAVNGVYNNRPTALRLLAIRWQGNDFVRFSMVIPQNASRDAVEGLKRMTYSFRPISEDERRGVKPLSIHLMTARAGDNVRTFAGRMEIDGDREGWFRALNALGPRDTLKAGVMYKVIR